MRGARSRVPGASGIAGSRPSRPYVWYRMLVSDVDAGVSQTPHVSTQAARQATNAFHLLYSASILGMVLLYRVESLGERSRVRSWQLQMEIGDVVCGMY